MMPREHRPQDNRPRENQAVAPPSRDVLVTVTTVTMVECDAESRLPMYESPPLLPSRMGEKGEFHTLELTEEEEQIRTLEHQMKQDLDI
jgi:hypothetical protein